MCVCRAAAQNHLWISVFLRYIAVTIWSLAFGSWVHFGCLVKRIGRWFLQLNARTRAKCRAKWTFLWAFQLHDERNYHIFYCMLAGLSSNEKEELELKSASDYYYLTQVFCNMFIICVGRMQKKRGFAQLLSLSIIHQDNFAFSCRFRERRWRLMVEMTWLILRTSVRPWKCCCSLTRNCGPSTRYLPHCCTSATYDTAVRRP